MADDTNVVADGTTTVEVTYEIWAALDRRKQSGESFDDVIRRLINATPVGVGQLKDADQPIHRVDFEEVPDTDEVCDQYDIIVGEPCNDPAVYKETVKYGEDGDPQTLFYCEAHGGE